MLWWTLCCLIACNAVITMVTSVKKGDRISIHYTGTLDDGTEFDSTAQHDGKPLEFIVGSGQVIPGFENGVMGMSPGEEKSIRVEPDQAYGERNPNMVKEVPRSDLPIEDVKVGMLLGAQTPDGRMIPVRVHELSDTTATLDLNHPLAGKVLNFSITLKDILEENCSTDPSSCGCGCSCDSPPDSGSGCGPGCEDDSHEHYT